MTGPRGRVAGRRERSAQKRLLFSGVRLTTIDGMSSPQSISVIVPTLDEESIVDPCLRQLRAFGFGEVLVVDGGSSDRTRELAAPLADVLLENAGGLYEQLNHGAGLASGDILLFHYADAALPDGAAESVVEALADPRVLGGAFRLGFSPSPRTPRAIAYKVIATFANARNRLGFGPFGDQSIFVRADVFRELGGFRPRALLADLELVRDLRRRGRFRILKSRIRSSVRRWERNGILATLLAHWRLSATHAFSRGETRASERLRRLRRVR